MIRGKVDEVIRKSMVELTNKSPQRRRNQEHDQLASSSYRQYDSKYGQREQEMEESMNRRESTY